MDVERHRKAAIERVLQGDATSSLEARQAAFADPRTAPEPIRALLVKVTEGAYRITDEDVAAVKLPEDEIFELVVAAAMGKATRQLKAANAAIEEVG